MTTPNLRRVLPALTLTTIGALTAAGCTANTPAGNSTDALQVRLNGSDCAVSTDSTPSGTARFSLVNAGTQPNEFEILAEDQLRIVAERENLGPGTTTDFTIVLEPGTYFTACKPNMIGAVTGLKKFTVTDSGKSVEVAPDEKAAREKSVVDYVSYIKDQVGALVPGTQEFAAAYNAGDIEKAKALYPRIRQHYERIEPTAEAFGDIDPKIDLREPNARQQGGDWTGWHVIEKDLWRPAGYAGLDDSARDKMASALVSDTKALYEKVYSPGFTVGLDDITNGAIALLEEVATTKVTGEEEEFSHTDLYDIQANLEGAKVAFGTVRSLAVTKDAAAVADIESRFGAVQSQLNRFRVGADGFRSFSELSPADRKQLSDAVNALRRPLATLTEIVVG